MGSGDVTAVKLLKIPRDEADRVSVVVLDRVEPGVQPAYCVHGRATCVGGCGEWLWLGHATHEAVESGRLAPLCQQCAHAHIPAGTRADGRLRDHLRADGPHG